MPASHHAPAAVPATPPVSPACCTGSLVTTAGLRSRAAAGEVPLSSSRLRAASFLARAAGGRTMLLCAGLAVALGLLALPGLGLAQPKARPKLALMPLVALRMDESVVQILSEILATEVANRGTYEVISASDINAMLGMEKMKSALGCDNESCLAEIGGALGADFMLSGSVGRLGDKLNISLVLFDQATVKVKGRVRESVPNDENRFEQGMLACLDKLLGPRTGFGAAAINLPPPDAGAGQYAGGAAAGSSSTGGATSGGGRTVLAPPVRQARDDWAAGAASVGYGSAGGVLLLALGSWATFESTGASMALGALATLGHGIIAPIIAAGGASARDDTGATGSGGLRAAGWIAYVVTWLSASALLYQGITDSEIFPAEQVLLTGLTGASALLCFALDASISHDEALGYAARAPASEAARLAQLDSGPAAAKDSAPALLLAPFVAPLLAPGVGLGPAPTGAPAAHHGLGAAGPAPAPGLLFGLQGTW